MAIVLRPQICDVISPYLHSSLGPSESTYSNGSAAFAGLTVVTDRQTDRPTERRTDFVNPSVAIGRIQLVLRCGLIYIYLSVMHVLDFGIAISRGYWTVDMPRLSRADIVVDIQTTFVYHHPLNLLIPNDDIC